MFLDPQVGAIVVALISLFGVYITVRQRGRKKPMSAAEQNSAMYTQINQFIDDQNKDREYWRNEVRQLRVDQRLLQLEIEKLTDEGKAKDERIDILQKQLDNERRNNKTLKKSLEQFRTRLKKYEDK